MFINCSVGAKCLSAGTKINLFLCSESIELDQIFTRPIVKCLLVQTSEDIVSMDYLCAY